MNGHVSFQKRVLEYDKMNSTKVLASSSVSHVNKSTSLGRLTNSPNVHTVETAVATIRFSGGAINLSDQSETESEPEEEYGTPDSHMTFVDDHNSSITSSANKDRVLNGCGPKHKSSSSASCEKETSLKAWPVETNSTITETTKSSSGSNSPGSPVYEEQLARMKTERFNPFDRESSDGSTHCLPKSSSCERSLLDPSPNSKKGML